MVVGNSEVIGPFGISTDKSASRQEIKHGREARFSVPVRPVVDYFRSTRHPFHKEVGTLEPGKRADLILVDGNPVESIHNIRNLKHVGADGKMYDWAELWRSVGFKP